MTECEKTREWKDGFSKRLNESMDKAGFLSFRKLSQVSGVSSHVLEKYAKTNNDSVPRVTTILKLASALNVSPSYLAFG